MEKQEVLLEKCSQCRYKGIAKIGEYDKEVCLATGEVILLEDIEKCPLEEVKEEKPVPVEIPYEIFEKVVNELEATRDILLKISDVFSSLTMSFDKEDLIALIRGKTRLRVRDITAVINAIERAKKVGVRDALKRFVSSVGNVPMSTVALVINEIERLNKKYGKERRKEVG